MLAKKAISDYLEGEVEDFYWIKRQSYSEIENSLENVLGDVSFSFKTKPYKHQLDSFFLGVCNSRFLYHLDMGLGKSKIVIDLIKFYSLERGNVRALVVVPSDINLEGWEEELKLHSDLTYHLMTGSSVERWDALNSVTADVFVVTYPALYRLCGDKKKGKKKITINTSKIKKINKLFNFIALDEIHKAKNKDTLTFRILDKITKDADFVYGCTGTPFGKDPIDLWAQFYLVDRGETFGTTLGFYREIFFVKELGYGGFPNYVFDNRLRDPLNSKIKNRSIRYLDSECQDLPSKVEMVKPVMFSEEAYSYYKPVNDTFIKAQKESDWTNTEVSFMGLRQLCSGFISLKDEESGEKTIVTFSNPSKVEMLKELLEQLPEDSKAVIFHEFVPSGRIIESVLGDLGIEYVSVRGEIKDKVGNIRKFKDKKDPVKVLVANSVTGGTGGNFQKVANYVIFYESPVSPIVRKQCIKRVYRGGQAKDRVFIIDILVKSSVEEKILQHIKTGNNLFNYILNSNTKDVVVMRTPLIGKG